jgi:acyl-CoA thioesterase FadM
MENAPCTVTAEYHIYMKRPTPTEGPVRIVATPGEVDGDRVEVSAELIAGGKVCATSTGLFVAVRPGHPAYHRW